MGLACKPEDCPCPTTTSCLPDTFLMNELFPAPVIPITAITTSNEFEFMVGFRLDRRSPNDSICLFKGD